MEEFIQQEAIKTLPWPAYSPDINPTDHVGHSWRYIHQRNPPIQTVAELAGALHQEWVLIPQQIFQRLFCSMRCRVQVINAHRS